MYKSTAKFKYKIATECKSGEIWDRPNMRLIVCVNDWIGVGILIIKITI